MGERVFWSSIVVLRLLSAGSSGLRLARARITNNLMHRMRSYLGPCSAHVSSNRSSLIKVPCNVYVQQKCGRTSSMTHNSLCQPIPTSILVSGDLFSYLTVAVDDPFKLIRRLSYPDNTS